MMSLIVRIACFLRALVFAIVFPFWTFLICVIVISASLLPDKFSRPLQDSAVNLWSTVTLLLAGLSVHAVGMERVPQGRGVLFVFNHVSHLDIPVIHHLMPHPRFGAKIELFHIPVFGRAVKAAGALPIARGQRDKVFKVYKEAEERFANGESFILAPEGSRQSGEALGAFKSGPFVFAINAQVDIVPIVIKGLAPALPKGKLLPSLDRWNRKIEVEFLEPIDARPFSLKERPILQEKTREAMLQAFSTES